jgi:hypothetical protein
MRLWDRNPVWPWAIVALLIATVSMLLFPFGLLMLGASLTVGGVVGYRINSDPRVRALAAGVIAGGVTSFLTLAAIVLYAGICTR